MKLLLSSSLLLLLLIPMAISINGPGDPDTDGLRNGAENYFGTNQNDWDSDNDGVGDGIEISIGTNATEIPGIEQGDADSDQLGNELENQIGTDKFSWDTDDDGIGDAIEYARQDRDPLIYESCSPNKSCTGLSNDWDRLSNIFEEDILGTNINIHDTDDDNFGDELEYIYGSDPLCKKDTPNSSGTCSDTTAIVEFNTITKFWYWPTMLFN